MQNYIFISCLFGKRFNKVHPSPDKERSYFFTNNKALETEISRKGWNYVYVDAILSDDYIISSLQSKYIKFLKFLVDFPEFDKNDCIIYFDHKEFVSNKTVDEIKKLIAMNQNKDLIIRQTPSLKTNVYDEVKAAMGQQRYVKNMNITIDFIKSMMKNKDYTENVRICNTGLLIYLNRTPILQLLNDVYKYCIFHKQPECQIYWSILSQKYKSSIHQIKWTDIKNIKRVTPT